MKISSSESSHSVYESFSDLLLNKLMILMFVLVGIVLSVAKKNSEAPVPVQKAVEPVVQVVEVERIVEKEVVVEKEVPVEYNVETEKKNFVIAYDGKCEVVFISTGTLSFTLDAFEQVMEQVEGNFEFSVSIDPNVPAKYKKAAEELCGKVAGLQKFGDGSATIKPTKLIPTTDSVFIYDVELSEKEFVALVKDLKIGTRF